MVTLVGSFILITFTMTFVITLFYVLLSLIINKYVALLTKTLVEMNESETKRLIYKDSWKTFHALE